MADTLTTSSLIALWIGGLAAIAHFWVRPWFTRQMGSAWSTRGLARVRAGWSGDRLWRFSLGLALAGTAVASGLGLAASRPSELAAAIVFTPLFLVGTWMAGQATLRNVSGIGRDGEADRERRRRLLGLVVAWLALWFVAGVLAYFPIESRAQAPLASGLIAAFVGLVAAQIVLLVIRVITALAIGMRR
jgi:hypothetical protein